jgi:hypothetical protein
MAMMHQAKMGYPVEAFAAALEMPGSELLDSEVSRGEYTNIFNCCCCWQTGGNKLTLTDKRVVVKTWESGCGGYAFNGLGLGL